MNFFKKLLGSSDENKSSVTKENGLPKKQLSDFFKTDLALLPDDDCFEGTTETNIAGSKFTNYHKTLDYIECGLFDVVEVRTFDDGSKNVFFKNYDLNAVNINAVGKLINELYLLNGPDDSDD